MLNCLNFHYLPLDPSSNGWKFVKNKWEPSWFQGSHIPNPDAVDESSEVHESVKTEKSGTVNKSGIVESAEADPGECEEISEDYNDEEEHTDLC